MSILLEKIGQTDKQAAEKIKGAGFRSDSEIRDLTQDDLQELFPRQLKRRKIIFETISKTDPVSELLKKLEGFIPHDYLKVALSNNGVMVDYLHLLKDMKAQLNNVQMFLEDNVRFLESSSDAPPGQEPASEMEIDGDKDAGSPPFGRKRKGEKMPVLLNKIRSIDKQAAEKIEKAEFRSDPEIKSLTEKDLQELFPGSQKIKMRKRIFETINKKDSVSEVLNDLRAFISHDNLKAALSNEGVMVDYLNILKDMKAQQNNVQMFLEANIRFLESSRDAPPSKEPEPGRASTSNTVVNLSDKNTKESSKQTPQESPRMTAAYGNSSSQNSYAGSTNSRFQKPEERDKNSGPYWYSSSRRKPQVTVKYKMVVSGKTFDANQQILEQIRSSAQELKLVDVEANQCVDDSQITLVFCPIVSRIGTDVEAAMKTVPGDKPVILVLMHHTHEVRHVASMKTWTSSHNVVLHVNVFYHEKVPGLIISQKNDEAITAVKNEILKHGTTDEHSGYLSDTSTSTGYCSDGANNTTLPKSKQEGFLSRLFY